MYLFIYCRQIYDICLSTLLLLLLLLLLHSVGIIGIMAAEAKAKKNKTTEQSSLTCKCFWFTLV